MGTITVLLIIFFPFCSGIFTIYLFTKLDQSKYQVRGVVGPYFAAIALLFGLFASLSAGDVWQRLNVENNLIVSEVNSLRTMLRIADGMVEHSEIKDKIYKEVDKFIKVEYALAEMEKNTGDTKNIIASKPLQAFFTILLDTKNFMGNTLAQSSLLNIIIDVKDYRFHRLELLKSHISIYKLILIIVLGVLTQFSIALCHAGNTRALISTVFLFSMAFSVTMFFLTIFENNSIFASILNLEPFLDVF
ncbi:MAG: hypothetical protein RIT35_887 [Pseudomonadota bacterium]|jgi:hypothetical protein